MNFNHLSYAAILKSHGFEPSTLIPNFVRYSKYQHPDVFIFINDNSVINSYIPYLKTSFSKYELLFYLSDLQTPDYIIHNINNNVPHLKEIIPKQTSSTSEISNIYFHLEPLNDDLIKTNSYINFFTTFYNMIFFSTYNKIIIPFFRDNSIYNYVIIHENDYSYHNENYLCSYKSNIKSNNDFLFVHSNPIVLFDILKFQENYTDFIILPSNFMDSHFYDLCCNNLNKYIPLTLSTNNDYYFICKLFSSIINFYTPHKLNFTISYGFVEFTIFCQINTISLITLNTFYTNFTKQLRSIYSYDAEFQSLLKYFKPINKKQFTSQMDSNFIKDTFLIPQKSSAFTYFFIQLYSFLKSDVVTNFYFLSHDECINELSLKNNISYEFYNSNNENPNQEYYDPPEDFENNKHDLLSNTQLQSDKTSEANDSDSDDNTDSNEFISNNSSLFT